MKLTVHLVAWNGAKYIPYLLASLRAQTFKDWELVVLDNNSTDSTAELIANELQNWSGPKQFIKNTVNNGFAGGHNQLYAATNSEYFLLLNQDLYLAPDCIEKLISIIEADEKLAVVSPRLMKWNFIEIEKSSLEKSSLEKSLSNTVDSMGLKVFRNRRVVEIGGGEEWQKAEAQVLGVFGVSGTMPLFRRNAIKAVEFSPTEFFDGSYFMYKEDVDLAFRLQSAGFAAAVVTGAIAYHDRTASGPRELSDMAAGKNKQNQSQMIKYHSVKNQLLTVYKNEYWQNLILDFPFVLWYEFKKWVWYLLFDWRVLTSHQEIWCLRKEMKTKRLLIKKTRKVSWKELRKWWA